MVLSFLWQKFYIDSYPFTQHLLNLQIDELSKETEKKIGIFCWDAPKKYLFYYKLL